MAIERLASPAPRVRMSKAEDAGDTGERGMEEVSATDATGSALPASGPVALVVVPPIVIPPAELCLEKRIILPFVERSIRYAVV